MNEDEKRLEEIKERIFVYEVAMEHYSDILNNTELLLKYISVFQQSSMIDAITHISSVMDALEEELGKLYDEKDKLETLLKVKGKK